MHCKGHDLIVRGAHVDGLDCIVDINGFSGEGYNICVSSAVVSPLEFRFFSLQDTLSFALSITRLTEAEEKTMLIMRIFKPMVIAKVSWGSRLNRQCCEAICVAAPARIIC